MKVKHLEKTPFKAYHPVYLTRRAHLPKLHARTVQKTYIRVTISGNYGAHASIFLKASEQHNEHMNKSALRTLYKEKRSDLDQDSLESLSLAIANKALKAPIWNFKTYHLFLPITRHKEIDTSFLLSVLQGKDKDIVISRADFNDGSMRHFLLTEETKIKVSSYGIPEPQSGPEVQTDVLDVVFIPLLAYDLRGNRVGYGKGFYDRFLESCPEHTIKVGLSLFPPCNAIEDVDEGDIPLSMCITPEEIHDFRD